MATQRWVVALALVLSTAGWAETDKKGCQDPQLFPTRIPGYLISDCKARDFDSFEFIAAKGARVRHEGKYSEVTYWLDDGQKEVGGLEIIRNYQVALEKIGGTVVTSDPQRSLTGKVVVDGREAWIDIVKGNRKIWLHIVESAQMKQHIVADATVFADGLRTSGHVSVEGIYFDTGKAVVKAESTPALTEVARLLKTDPALKLWVVGHTDAVGTLDDNLKLSAARAEAVVAELVKTHGVAAARLKGQGVGPLAPVASNDAEDGRAKNRRVELVKQ